MKTNSFISKSINYSKTNDFQCQLRNCSISVEAMILDSLAL